MTEEIALNTTRESPLDTLLNRAMERSGFDALVLASLEGLPLANAPNEYAGDEAAAVVAFLEKASVKALEQMRMATLDEITIRSSAHNQLVCRRLTINQEDLVLIAVMPQDVAYRRAMNWTIYRVRKLLSGRL